MASNGAYVITQDDGIGISLWGNILAITSFYWGNVLALTSFVASMVLNALVTGLIAFRIHKVFSAQVKPASVEQNLGSLNSTGGPKLRHIVFIIIQSGMALFAIQLAHVVITILNQGPTPLSLHIAFDLVIPTHQILNVIIISGHFYFCCFTDNIYLPRASHQH